MAEVLNVAALEVLRVAAVCRVPPARQEKVHRHRVPAVLRAKVVLPSAGAEIDEAPNRRRHKLTQRMIFDEMIY